ncbi:NRDE family protein [Fluviispira multicolorata]|uniref:Transport and Golgi organization protein 2 n=1 Tax=Fluviispira multicolorata TaxID=2654512 RepID=A0A833JD97_9BACT|nr:NRDE family protein [Fluviispira multicolorata]KAB8031032.1 hypothetical protein GCL57_08685 [Fluviispira multicolorata]
MCTLFLLINQMESVPVALISNRDEYRGRLSAEIQGWDLQFLNRGNQLLGPRDDEQKGTWFACENKWHGKWAALTNVRDFKSHKNNMKSRGEIITRFLQSNLSAKEYLSQLIKSASEYNYYNIIFSDADEIIFFNSKTLEQKVVYKFGDNNKYIFALSNGTLDSDWPKISVTKKNFSEYFSQNSAKDAEFYWNYFKKEMMNSKKYDSSLLPNTGVSNELEVFLSSLFIDGEKYGTRSTIFFGIEKRSALFLYEQTYLKDSLIQNSKKISVQYDIL